MTNSRKPKMKKTMWSDVRVDDVGDSVFFGFEAGGRGGEFINGAIQLDPETFPPGTTVVVKIPHCPDCTQEMPVDSVTCSCGFSSRDWLDGGLSS